MLTLLKALVKSNAVRTGETGPGLFVKIMYTKRVTNPASTGRTLGLNELLPISAENNCNKCKRFRIRILPLMPFVPPPGAPTVDEVASIHQDGQTFCGQKQATPSDY